jgi:hypothetical protein
MAEEAGILQTFRGQRSGYGSAAALVGRWDSMHSHRVRRFVEEQSQRWPPP